MSWSRRADHSLSRFAGEGWGEGILICICLALAACEREPAPAPVALAVVRAAPSLAALGALEYPLTAFDGARVQLASGHYEAPPDQSDEDREIASAELHPLSSVGDLDGDGSPDAAVVLQSSGGGSGTFCELVAVLNTAAGLTPLPGVPLGDRIKLERLDVRGGVISVELLKAGPADPLCCPKTRVKSAFQVADGQLVVADPAPPAL